MADSGPKIERGTNEGRTLSGLVRVPFERRSRLSGGAVEEVVNGHENGVLLPAREALDPLQAFQHLAAGLALLDDFGRGVGLEQFLDGHFEGGGEPQRRFCGNAELADFVIGDDRAGGPPISANLRPRCDFLSSLTRNRLGN